MWLHIGIFINLVTFVGNLKQQSIDKIMLSNFSFQKADVLVSLHFCLKYFCRKITQYLKYILSRHLDSSSSKPAPTFLHSIFSINLYSFYEYCFTIFWQVARHTLSMHWHAFILIFFYLEACVRALTATKRIFVFLKYSLNCK